MLFKHNRRCYSVLQDGMDVAPSFPKDCDVLLGTPGALLDLFSPGKGTENLNQAISCSNVHGVFLVHERYWFCLVQVSATQICTFPSFSWQVLMMDPMCLSLLCLVPLRIILFLCIPPLSWPPIARVTMYCTLPCQDPRRYLRMFVLLMVLVMTSMGWSTLDRCTVQRAPRYFAATRTWIRRF